jgi:hypothetical protein
MAKHILDTSPSTLVPLVQSLLKYVVYFGATVAPRQARPFSYVASSP